MKQYLKLMARTSEVREALNRYMSETPTDKRDAKRVTELQGALNDAEKEFRTAVESIDEANDAGNKERRQLSDRIELRNYMTAALEGRQVKGAEAEFNKEIGLDDTGVVPWEAFEERANEVTVPDTVLDKKRQPLLNRIFERTRVGYLGIRMPSVDMGEPVYPVMTSGAAGASFAEGADTPNEDATFVGSTVSPKRLSGRYSWRLEQTTRFLIEDTLRSDLRTVMGELLDKQIINGLGGTGGTKATDFDGLMRNHADSILGPDLTAAGANSYNIQPDTAPAFKAGISSFIDYVDGKGAADVGEIRTLIGVETYRRFNTLFQADTGVSLDFYLRRANASFAVSTIIAAKHAKFQQAFQTRRPGDIVAPVWRGVSMIRDPYSGAASATVSLTAHMLANLIVIRTHQVGGKARAEHSRKLAFQLDA